MTRVRVLAALAVFALLGLTVGGGASARPQVNFDVAVTVSVSGGQANSSLRTAAEGELTNHRFSSYSWSATFEFKGVPDAGNFSVDAGATGQASWTINSSRRIPGDPQPTCQSTLTDGNGSLGGTLVRAGGQLALQVAGGFQADDPCADHSVSIVFAENLFRIFRPDAQTPIGVLQIPLPETIIRGASVTPQVPDYDDSYQYQYEELGDVLVATSRAQVRVTSECRAGGTCGRAAQVLDDRFPEPPPQLPPPVGRVLVQVSGAGTVTTTSAAARRVQDTVQQIRCGRRGYQCYAEAPPETSVTMRATPGPGQRFQSWTGGCEGRDALCTVAAGATTTVGAVFVPARRTNVTSVALRPPQLSVRWRRSVGKGTLVVSGSVGARAKVRLQLRRPRGGPLLTRVLNARGGFQLRAPLNKLAGGATLLPGGFVVSLTGSANGAALPLQVRTLSVPAPAEGVVRRAYASASQNGRPARKLRRRAREAWATFQLASQPTAAPVTVSWYQGRRLIGTREKSNRPVIQTAIGASAGLPSGTYRVDLVAGGRVVRRLNVKVAR